MIKKEVKDVRYREVKKGRYVSERSAKKHPGTTVKETDKKKN